MSFPPTDPDAFVLAESIPPGQLVGHRIWVQGFGPGVVLKFEKAWVGFGTSTHTIRFQGGVEEKVKLRRHGNGKTPFVLIPSDESNAVARPVKTVFRYIVEDGSDSGSEPVTPSDAAPAQDILTEIDASQATHPMDVAPGSLVEHLEGQAWNMCARIADPQNAYSSSALSESLSESPCMGFSLTPPERQRLQMQDDIYFTKTTPLGPPSGPMDIPENDEDDDGIRRVEHTLSESGTIFTPGEHKWICAGSPSARGDFLAMIQHGGPPEHAANTSACV